MKALGIVIVIAGHLKVLKFQLKCKTVKAFEMSGEN